MDYLELEESALLALEELDGGFNLQRVSSRPSISMSTPIRKRPRRRVEASYLLRLEKPLPTPQDVANALGLSCVPQLGVGDAEDGKASFCRPSQSGINTLDSWVKKNCPTKKFTKIRIGLAHKAIDELPLLGRDATLPQHRPHSSVTSTGRQVLEYPIHYFLYGMLADPGRLERLLGIPAFEIPPLQPATLFNGSIRAWAGKYRASIDDPEATVNGFAYLCKSADQEDAPRIYKSDNDEVVAAKFMIDGK